jgi:hexulose-6-phosphate isomerase
VAALKTALTVASMWHAEEVIVRPAVIGASSPPSAAWTRSQEVLGQLLPLAGGFKLHITLAVPTEKFLLSPADCTSYIDGLKSPWAKASLDVGDALVIGTLGTPQEWVRSLGRRLTRLRLNDRHVDRKAGTSERRNIGDGDVNWQDVRKAMSEAPYLNWVTADVDPGDRAYLSNVRIRVDKFLAGFKPGSGPG